MGARIYTLHGKRRRVSRAEFLDVLNTIEKYIGQLYPTQLNEAHNIIVEMKFNGAFNSKFREEHMRQLEVFLDELYIEDQKV